MKRCETEFQWCSWGNIKKRVNERTKEKEESATGWQI